MVDLNSGKTFSYRTMGFARDVPDGFAGSFAKSVNETHIVVFLEHFLSGGFHRELPDTAWVMLVF